MKITREVINDTLCKHIPYSNGNVLSIKGLELLVGWSEQQTWWHEFARQYHLGHNWRKSYLGDPNVFALNLFRFLVARI
jgi:hypothetical protein